VRKRRKDGNEAEKRGVLFAFCLVVERKWIGTEKCRIRRAAVTVGAPTPRLIRSGAVRELRISNSGLKEILTLTQYGQYCTFITRLFHAKSKSVHLHQEMRVIVQI
jgi:hypothetical protein